ncbi:hypothetical protein ABE504_27075 [Paenibacillus oryzisoli]|uniref:hypothetical protein n=1 Tax=Paenibacillus oryzisoli TaxID=1850517 RepID=UPI003D2E4C08
MVFCYKIAQDAYVIAAWLREKDQNGTLVGYFQADTLTESEEDIAQLCEEGDFGLVLGL